MKFITFLALLMSFILFPSCGKHEYYKNIGKDQATKNRSAKNKKDVYIVVNNYDFSFTKRKDKRIVPPTCRGIEGCLQVCQYFNHRKCKQSSAFKVTSLWLGKTAWYNDAAQSTKDLNFIASQEEVSAFLKNMDKKNRILKGLLSSSVAAQCPIGQDNLLYSFSPLPSLYIVPPVKTAEAEAEKSLGGADFELNPGQTLGPPEQQAATVTPQVKGGTAGEAAPLVEGVDYFELNPGQTLGPPEQHIVMNPKKITDASMFHFDMPIFAGFVKKCFGGNSKSFSEVAAELENKEAFDLGHQVISEACGDHSECIRLAYCSMNSESVWNYLPKEMKEKGCDYENFIEMF